MTQIEPLRTDSKSVPNGVRHGGVAPLRTSPPLGGGVRGGGAPAPGPLRTSRKRTEWSSLGGQYRAPTPADANQTHLHLEEPELDFERARCGIDLGGTYW